MTRVILALIAGIVVHQPATLAADKLTEWTKVTTPNFELYTSAGEGTGRRALKHFETIRSFFQQSMPSNKGQNVKVRIIVFKNQKEFAPYSPNEVAAAYYVPGHDYDYIVMNGFTASSRTIAVHEYMHLLTRHQEVKLPIWLNEGFAMLYENLESAGKQVKVGALHGGRRQQLINEKWIDMTRLTEVKHDSPEYNTKRHAGQFYSQSWALTHMLNLDPNYAPQIQDFLIKLIQTESAVQAFADVYGKSPDDIRNDLRAYVEGQRFFIVLFDVKLERYADQPDVAPADQFEARMVLATLFSRLRDKRDQAREAFEQLAREFPDKPGPHEALGYLAWRTDGLEAMAPHLRQAIELGTTNAKVYYDFAAARLGDASDPKTRVSYFIKATKLREGYREAHKAAAFAASASGQWGLAVANFRKLGSVQEEEAYRVLSSSAYALYKLKQWDDAKRNAEAARQWAKDPSEIDRIANLIEAIEWESDPAKREEMIAQQAAEVKALRRAASRGGAVDLPDGPPVLRRPPSQEPPAAPPPVESRPVTSTVEGELKRFDCLEGTARIHVRMPSETVALMIRDPTAIALIDNGPRTGEFICGEQEPRNVVVEYTPNPDVKHQTIGDVRSIELQ